TCQQCGETFLAEAYRAKKTKYCSPKCRYTALSEQRQGKRRSEYVACTCQRCGKPFSVIPSRVSNGGGKYCCARCRARAVADAHRGPNHHAWRQDGRRMVAGYALIRHPV